MFIKPPFATAASRDERVHLFVCLSVAKLQKSDILKSKMADITLS